MRRSILALVALPLMAGAPGWSQPEADWALDPAALYDMGAQVFELAPPEIKEQFYFPPRAEWTAFWTQIEEALQSGSLENLAWLAPEAENALAFLELTPATEPYAAWLAARVDYFDMAGNVMQVIPAPAQQPAPPKPTALGKRVIVRSAPPPPPLPGTSSVAAARNKYVQNTEVWRRKMEKRPVPARGAALIPRLKNIFADEGLPRELVWIAEVESTLNPQARSPVGAAGLFQFMPATAMQYGLKLQPEDERLVPEKSARAAARYLKALHQQFGSWPLSFAAYNAGDGRVRKLLKNKPQKTFAAISDQLPSETRMYVPKILALVQIREQVDVEKLPGPRLVKREACPPMIITARLWPDEHPY